MQATQVYDYLKSRKGQHVQISWTRDAKTKTDVPMKIQKSTTAFVRAGIDYENLAQVRNDIANGKTVGELPWGVWRDGYFPFIIDHQDKEYIRLYPAVFNNLKPQVEWTMNGKQVDYKAIEPYLLASEKPRERDEQPTCFTINADSIRDIQ